MADNNRDDALDYHSSGVRVSPCYRLRPQENAWPTTTATTPSTTTPAADPERSRSSRPSRPPPSATSRSPTRPASPSPASRSRRDPDAVYKYTAKGNLVAVITNGTAVLGLGNIGALAGKPVMEGKGVLFKRFADIDVFDLELDTRDTEEFIRCVKLLEPTFGGINLEDIAAPECFEIEERLKEEMKIPVFHDDQHGTAIISAAALLNALEVAGKKIEDVQVVFSGAGAAAIACLRLYIKLGVRKENVLLVDRHGVIYKGRKEDMTPYKEEFAADTDRAHARRRVRAAPTSSSASPSAAS